MITLDMIDLKFRPSISLNNFAEADDSRITDFLTRVVVGAATHSDQNGEVWTSIKHIAIV